MIDKDLQKSSMDPAIVHGPHVLGPWTQTLGCCEGIELKLPKEGDIANTMALELC